MYLTWAYVDQKQRNATQDTILEDSVVLRPRESLCTQQPDQSQRTGHFPPFPGFPPLFHFHQVGTSGLSIERWLREKATRAAFQHRDNVVRHVRDAGSKRRRFGTIPARERRHPDSDGAQCDKVIPACTNCIAVDAECIARNFASGPIPGTGSLSHATVPRYSILMTIYLSRS